MAIRNRIKKATAKKPKTPVATPEVKSVDSMIEARPAHSTSVMREYLRDLIKHGEQPPIKIKKEKK